MPISRYVSMSDRHNHEKCPNMSKKQIQKEMENKRGKKKRVETHHGQIIELFSNSSK